LKAWIEANFGGNIGATIVRREAAQAIKEAMQEIKETKSGVKFKIDASRNRYGRPRYSATGRIQRFASDIMVAAEWMREDDAQDSGNMHLDSLINLQRTFEGYSYEVSFGTPEIFTMANSNMIQVTPRASAVEFKISHQTAERLQAFLTKYGDQQEKHPRAA
jgi:hypothetical protein